MNQQEFKYTYYAWRSDDEGGCSICYSEDFSPYKDYYPETGWRAKPSKKIADFNTALELADLLIAGSPWFYKDKSLAIKDAEEMINSFINEEEYKEY